MTAVIAAAKALVGQSVVVTTKDGTTVSAKVVKVLGKRIDLKVPVPAAGLKSGPNSAYDIADITPFGDDPFVTL